MGLKKLTELKQKTCELLEKEIITEKDLAMLTKDQAEHFRNFITEKLNNSRGEELDKLREKVYPILSQKTKNEIWEHNHRLIIQEISKFIEEYGRMPLRVDIAGRVGLSRQTLYKHFKEYKENPLYTDHLETFRFMTEKLIAKMFQFALHGDVKAGRLYFEMIGQIGGPVIKNQTNYIQVNNLVISEERLKALRPDQLKRIEEILTEVENIKFPK